MRRTPSKISRCPLCGSARVARARRDWQVEDRKGKRMLLVPSLSFWECKSCGEKFFDHETMKAIARAKPRKAQSLAA